MSGEEERCVGKVSACKTLCASARRPSRQRPHRASVTRRGRRGPRRVLRRDLPSRGALGGRLAGAQPCRETWTLLGIACAAAVAVARTFVLDRADAGLPLAAWPGGRALVAFRPRRGTFSGERPADFCRVALRTGAFSAAERFGRGDGRGGFAATLRLLAEDFDVTLWDAAGREASLLAPLMTGSLMRSTRFSQIAPKRLEPQETPAA